MDDPQTPTPPAPPESVPWWRRVAEIAGLDDEIDAVTGAATTARDWIQSKLPSPSAAQAETARFDAAVKAYQAERARQGQASWDAVAAPVKRFFGHEKVQQFGHQLKEDYQPLWTPDPGTTALAEAAHQHITRQSDALRAALPTMPVTLHGGADFPDAAMTGRHNPFRGVDATVDPLKPLDWAAGAHTNWIPNLAINQAADMSTPLGAVSNLDVPIAPALKAAAPFLAKAGGAAAHLAGMLPGFYSRVDKIAEAVSAKGMHPNKLASLLKSGASSEEVAYRKLPEFLASKGNQLVTRDELAAHLAAHPPPQIERTVLGGSTDPAHVHAARDLLAHGTSPDDALTALQDAYRGATPAELRNALDAAQQSNYPGGPTKYESYTLPGGENYRESLTQLAAYDPRAAHREQVFVDYANKLDAVNRQLDAHVQSGYTLLSRSEMDALTAERAALEQGREAAAEQFRRAGPVTDAPSFRSSHFDQPNILVHARTTERTLPPAPMRSLPEIEQIIQDVVGAKRPEHIASGGPQMAVRQGLITHDEAALYGQSRGFTNYPHAPTGPRGRFIEETQSDWHQQAKRLGYQGAELQARAAEAKQAAEAARDRHVAYADEFRRRWEAEHPIATPTYEEWRDKEITGSYHGPEHEAENRAIYNADLAAGRYIPRGYEGERGQALRADPINRQLSDASTALAQRAQDLAREAQSGIPDAPFKETWPDLALKQQLLDVANRQDLSWLGFTSGKTQAARYDLSKQVSKIDYDPHAGILRAFDHNGEQVITEHATPDELADYIGKEPADKLRTQIDAHEQRRAYERSQWSTEIDPDTGQYLIIDPNGEVVHDWAGDVERYSQEEFANHAIDERLRESDEAMQASAAADRDPYLPSLTGLDLQVGGEGMHHFYDQLLPRRLEKLVKPFGGTVEQAAIPAGQKQAMVEGPAWRVVDSHGHEFGTFPAEESAIHTADAARGQYPTVRVVPTTRYHTQLVEHTEPSWIARLSPEQKARIRTEGFPLMSLLPPAAVGLGAAGAAHALSGDDDQGGGAGLAAGLAAAVPFLPPGIRRPGLTKSGRAAIEEARLYLQQLGLRGAVPRHELETVLQEAPLAYHAHHVTKGLPAEPPLKAAKRILLPGEQGYDFAPAATTRVHGMADIGAALPQQANWGGATDPALLPAFDNNPQAADLFGRFFAALSPRTSVPKNALEAITVWRDYLQHPGRQFTDARLRELGVGNVRSKTNNLTRAMIGEGPSGPKVDPFTDYMTGQARLPVPDVHGLYAIGSRHGAIDDVVPELRTLVQRHEGIPKKSGGLTEKDYVHRLLDAFGRSLQSYDPAKPMGPLFGSMWEGTRAQKGHAFQGGMIDIYKSRGLTEPGALLDVQALGRAIRDWSRR